MEARTRKRPPTGSEAAIDGRSTFRKERMSCASACLELWILFHASKAEIKQVRHLGGDEFLIDLHVLAPPLTYLSDAAGEDLPVDGRRCGIEPLLLQKRGEENGDLVCDVGHDGLEGLAPDGGGRLVGEQMESVGVLLDEVEKGDDDSLKMSERAFTSRSTITW